MKRLIALTTGLLLLFTPTANAHTALVSSNPKNNAMLTKSPTSISINYNEDLIKISGKNVSKKDFNGGYFERRRWRWFGFSINEDGTGYVTMNAQSTYTITPIEESTTNHEPFTVGDVPAAANSSSFIGKLDQVVVYHRFMKLEDLARIMETKE